jgi:diadenosine tetraphosphate (Ap4A) HIT family hydrolase
MTSFVLDERLAADTLVIGDGPLSRILLINDSRFPWAVLVPRRMGLADWVDLSAGEVTLLDGEIRTVTAALRALRPFHKLNVASLGNMVRQLHVHVVAREEGDAAWPRPVWGVGAAVAYREDVAAKVVAKLRREMGFAA